MTTDRYIIEIPTAAGVIAVRYPPDITESDVGKVHRVLSALVAPLEANARKLVPPVGALPAGTLCMAR